MTDAYSLLADYYDTFTGNVDYRQRADFVDGELSAFGNRGLILDAGCGTGELSLLLQKKGYDVIGVDISEDMLAKAREKNPGQLLLCQDLTELDLYGTVQGIVCMQDTLNHMSSLKEVKEILRRFSLFSEPDSRIIFDLNTEYKHRVLLNDRSYVYETDGAMFVWQNQLEKNGAVTMLMDLFTAKPDGSYLRQQTQLTEILITSAEILKLIDKAGLRLCKVYDGDNYGPLREDSERAVYVTEKL